MNNNKNTQSPFTQGTIAAESIINLDTFMESATLIQQADIKHYLNGVLAGLSMRLGRLQNAVDVAIDNDDEDYAESLEADMAHLATMIEKLATRE